MISVPADDSGLGEGLYRLFARLWYWSPRAAGDRRAPNVGFHGFLRMKAPVTLLRPADMWQALGVPLELSLLHHPISPLRVGR